MTLDFFMEIGCEEIPASSIEAILEQLDQKFCQSLANHGLSSGQIETYATPRRLIVCITQLAAFQSDRTETITGPRYSIAFSPDHVPTKAAEGFLRKYNLRPEELKRIEKDEGQYLGFEKKIVGRSAREILCDEIPSIITGLEFSKNMRWEASRVSFVRPIRWLLCLLDGEVLPVGLAGVEASNITYGHRILDGNVEKEVHSFKEFSDSLLNLHVHFKQRERLEKISSLLEQVSREHQGRIRNDKELLRTVVYLNEHPSVVCGNFDPCYLRLPQEVLVTLMREHQKYFSIQNEQGQLLPKFLAVVDSDEKHHDIITWGHERVLRARLADANFFWDVDHKVSLEDRVEKLKGILYHAKLGTVYEKAKRIGRLAQFIARSMKQSGLLAKLDLAAKLCKTDLTTEMVKEFTNLQGIMGGLYAKAQGIPEEVAQAIYDHYRPTSLEDESPRHLEGAILSLADKLDSVIGAFSIGVIPTGSKDPLALRRQAIGLIKVLLDKRLSLPLGKISRRAYANLGKYSQRPFEEVYPDVEAFLKDRLKFIFREQGYRYDEINAIVEADWGNPLDCQERLKAIAGMRHSQDFYSLAISFKRIKNIIVKAGVELSESFSVDPSLFQIEEEKLLYQTIRSIGPKVKRARRSHQYQKAFELMASLRPQVDLFFDKVLVMTENPLIQKNRLGLLGTLLQIFLGMADISEIVVSSSKDESV